MARITLNDQGCMTHMPFLAPRKNENRILFFCKAERQGMWKLHFEDQTGIHQIKTGLSEDTVECSPTAWLDETGWHVSFIGGFAQEDRRYYLYRMDGHALETFRPAKKVIKTGAGFIYKNRLVHTKEGMVFIDENQEEIRTIEMPHHRIFRMSYEPDFSDKLLITALNVKTGTIYQIEHDLNSGEQTRIECDGKTAYKCAILGNEIVYADKLGVDFEERKICAGNTISRQIVQVGPQGKIIRKPEAHTIGKERFAICKTCDKSKNDAFGCEFHKGCCFGQWRANPANKCALGLWPE